MNSIYIRRRSKLLLPDAPGTTPLPVVAALQKNIENLGFRLSAEAADRLRATDPTKVEAFYKRLVKDLREQVGAHREFMPFYPNFPDQVMEASEAELYWNAIAYYITSDRPDFETIDRPALTETTKYRVLGVGTRDEFDGLFTLLAKAKTAWSVQDREDVTWFVAQHGDGINRLLPDAIPCKENVAVLAAELLKAVPDAVAVLDPHIKTATDVLRVAVAMSGGDVSLAAATPKFGKFRRRERAALLGWIDRAANATEDMLRRVPRWVRLGERLHPGEYAGRFPRAAAAFDVIRNDRPFETFNSQIEAGLLKRDTAAVLELLDARPGELARRLDHLARTAKDPAAVVTRFADRAAKVSTPVLLQVLTHFRHRSAPAPLRVFFPKGQVANVYATETPLPPLPAGVADSLAGACEAALLERFATLPPLGKCHLDERLKNYPVPFALRSESKALRTLVRGSRLPLPACHTLRFFVWWKNGSSRADIDLSAALYDADFKHVTTVAYYNLKEFGGHHSGDITDAPKGAAEFIDVGVSQCRERKVRFVVMCLNSYTEQPYCDLPECFAGWMARQEPNSGEVFEPKTVADKLDVAADTKFCLPAVFDLESGEVIWADIALATTPRWANNVRNHLGGVSLMLRAVVGLRKPDLHTLFGLHARARGTVVPATEPADTTFGVDEGVTPFDVTRIAAEYL